MKCPSDIQPHAVIPLDLALPHLTKQYMHILPYLASPHVARCGQADPRAEDRATIFRVMEGCRMQLYQAQQDDEEEEEDEDEDDGAEGEEAGQQSRQSGGDAGNSTTV